MNSIEIISRQPHLFSALLAAVSFLAAAVFFKGGKAKIAGNNTQSRETLQDTHKQNMLKSRAEHRQRVKKARDSRGVVIVNTGDGKGKSTAAFGTAFRAVGYGMKVGIVQFIKGKGKTGEQESFGQFENITHVISGDGFTWDTQDTARDIESAMKGWDTVLEMIEKARKDVNSYQLLVLDEINIAMNLGYLPVEAVADTLASKPEHLSIILTGRNAPKEIIEIADTVTEMTLVNHAFENGIQARKGIEF